tara:strand:+ start:410 stop:1264 length:855 start_codon:yes stop_codon:yes gene_type:complete
MTKKKLINIAGFTLIEVLIAVVITTLMMAAMFTSYSLVNSTYRQVTDRAKISQAGRDTVGAMLREIRMAGFKYINDNIAASTEHNPIKITQGAWTTGSGECDKIEIVYGGHTYDSGTSTSTYERYKITYECAPSQKIDETTTNKAAIDGFAIYKSKEKWDTAATPPVWSVAGDENYEKELILDYVQDLVFIPYDENGKIMEPPGGSQIVPTDAKAYDVRTIDIGLVIRSTKAFFKQDTAGGIARKIISIASTGTSSDRYIEKADKYLRDTISVTAHARNIGLDQ